jgi:hypothetical protein
VARSRTLRLAVLATLRIVLELLVVKEQLLSGSEYKLVAAINALEDSIEELHRDTLAFAPQRMHSTRIGPYSDTSQTSRKNGALPQECGTSDMPEEVAGHNKKKRIERADPKG